MIVRDRHDGSIDNAAISAGDATKGRASKVIGLYQIMLKRVLEHFFPEGRLDPAEDRSSIEFDWGGRRANFVIGEDPDGLGVSIEWFRSRYFFRPTSPTPFSASERRLIQVAAHVLDARFRTMFDLGTATRPELFHYAVEDFVVGEFLSPPNLLRVPIALETLRVAALSTYEARRVSTGVMLLGTTHDPSFPRHGVPESATPFDIRLSSLKSFHRLCDGLRTLFLVNRDGMLGSVVDVERWSRRVEFDEPNIACCPRIYAHHSRATLSGQHIGMVLTPWQEIKVFAGGQLAFAFSDARWRLLDIPAKFAVWKQAAGETTPSDLADRIFHAALNLSEDHIGALIVVLRDPEHSFTRLVAPGDRIHDGAARAGDDDAEQEGGVHGFSSQQNAGKHLLHQLVRDQNIDDMDPAVLEALAGVDGAVVTDRRGRLLSFGAILRIPPETMLPARAVEGARTTASLVASFHGPVLKVSEDGFLTMYLGGRRIWEI